MRICFLETIKIWPNTKSSLASGLKKKNWRHIYKDITHQYMNLSVGNCFPRSVFGFTSVNCGPSRNSTWSSFVPWLKFSSEQYGRDFALTMVIEGAGFEERWTRSLGVDRWLLYYYFRFLRRGWLPHCLGKQHFDLSVIFESVKEKGIEEFRWYYSPNYTPQRLSLFGLIVGFSSHST